MTIMSGVMSAVLMASFTSVEPPLDQTANLVELTWDRKAQVNDSRRLGTVTGTITCDQEGWLRGVEAFVVQEHARGSTNEDINPFLCSTEPRRFRALMETEDRYRAGRTKITFTQRGNVVGDGYVWFQR